MAIFVDFLSRQSNEQRRCMRNVRLRENRHSISRPFSHVEGLMPYMEDCPQMRVEWHVSMRDTLLPSCWRICPEANDPYTFGHEAINAITDWFENAQILFSPGKSPHTISIVLEGHTDEAAFSWTMIKRAASLQEAMLEILRRHEMPVRQVAGDAPSALASPFRSEHPCNLPLCFGSMVRDIINNNSVIRFQGHEEEMWNLKDLVAARLNWKLSQWRKEWETEIDDQVITMDIWQQLKLLGRPDNVGEKNGNLYLRLPSGVVGAHPEYDEDGEDGEDNDQN